jgi:LysR family hydrogen peroxide-inducible transcriptional activator
MNIRDLRYFLAVVKYKHFGKAAESCFVSQPTLSAQLKKMEEFLGVQLLERSNKHVTITPVGEAIAVRAQRIISETDDLIGYARSLQDPFSAEIRIGSIPTLGPYLLPHLIPTLRTQFPDLKLRLYEGQTHDVVKRLRDGALDMLVLAVPVDIEGLSSKVVFREPFYLAVPQDHPLASKSKVKVDQLKETELLLLEDGHCLRQHAMEFCAWQAAADKQNFEATSLETLRNMVSAGAGITMMPKLAVPAESTPSLTYIPFEKPEPGRDIAVVWRKETSLGVVIDAISEILASLFSK